MRKSMNLVWSGFLILLALTTISAGLRISGGVFEADVTPGEHVMHEISIYNTSSPANFTVVIDGLGQQSNGGTIDVKPDQDTSPYSARSFLTVSPSKFHLEPGASQTVKVEGDIPNNISGGRYAMVSIRSGVVGKMAIGQNVVGFAVGSNVPVRLTVSNTNLLQTGKITELKVDEPISARQQNISLNFTNTGNYHLSGLAKAELKDANGNLISNASTPLSGNIYPTFSNLFMFSLVPVNKLKPGTYDLNATVNLEDGTVLASKEKSFVIKS